MRLQEAHVAADELVQDMPCMQVVMIANGHALLKERGAPVPAWTIPAASYVILFRWRCGHLRGTHVSVGDTPADELIGDAVKEAICVDRDELADTWVYVDSDSPAKIGCGKCALYGREA